MKPIQFVAQLNSIKTSKDGGGKIILEFGFDSMEAVLELQRLNGEGEINLAIAVVPFEE